MVFLVTQQFSLTTASPKEADDGSDHETQDHQETGTASQQPACADAPASTDGHDGRASDSAGLFDSIDRIIRTAGAALVRRYPRLERPLRRLREHYAQLWIRARTWRYNLGHTAPVDPYRIVWIDPDRLELMSPGVDISRFKRFGKIRSGDWDQNRRRFTESAVYRGFEAHFEDGVPWEETEFYETIASQLDAGQERWDCRSRADLDDRCRKLDRFYETIEDHGVLTQRELVHSDVTEAVTRDRETVHSRIVNDEIAIDIARDGELLFADGRNRLAIAKLLDIDEIPVVILQRHPIWVSFREAVGAHVNRTESLPTLVADHPDLKQLAPD